MKNLSQKLSHSHSPTSLRCPPTTSITPSKLLHLVSQNWVTWPFWATKESGEMSLFQPLWLAEAKREGSWEWLLGRQLTWYNGRQLKIRQGGQELIRFPIIWIHGIHNFPSWLVTICNYIYTDIDHSTKFRIQKTLHFKISQVKLHLA